MTTPPIPTQEKPTAAAEMTPAENPVSTAAASSASAASTTSAAAAAPDAPVTSVAPAIGSRIVVLWELESPGPDGETVTEARWWGAVVQAAERGADGTATHILLYDGYGEFGEDVARVRFGKDDTLIDLARVDDEMGGMLHWRMEGATDDKGTDPVSMVDVAEEQMMMDTADGESMTAAGMAALEALPRVKQLQLASGYRAFADRVKSMLAQIASDKGAGYVVTDVDIQQIFQTLQSEGGATAAAAAAAMPPGAL